MSNELDNDIVNDIDQLSSEVDTKDVNETPKEMAIKQDERAEKRDPKTGQFITGWKGGGRPKGSKDKLNQQVIGTLEKIWAARGDEIIEHLAAEKPEVLAGLVAKLIPQSLAAEAIEGEASGKGQQDQQVTIKVVTQQHHDALPTREVEGELLLDEPTTH
jgi:hypothetical protein